MTAPPALPARVSAIEAAREAIEHTKHHLFPIRFERWLALGFVAFLDQCGRSGGLGVPGPGGSNWGEGGGEGGGPDIARITDWMAGNIGLLVLLAAAGLALIVAFWALVLWVNSRGIFMYLDDVATGRADVARPWREHADRAGSLFAWQFGLVLATLILTLVLLLLGAGVFLGAARAGAKPEVAVLLAVLAIVLPFLLLAVGAALASVALRDFAAPLQLQAGVSCGPALRLLVPLVRAHAGSFVLYVLLKIAFSMAAGIVLLSVCCFCCCLLLPVVCQTVLQPVFYFERAWSLCLLRQLGYDLLGGSPAFDVPAPTAPPASPPEGLGSIGPNVTT